MIPTIRVLYAEDNPQDADLTRSWFAAHAPEFDIEVVGTGQRCLERLRETAFDLLLLDHRLPDMDGPDVLRTLVHADIQVPVVMVTGAGDEDLPMKVLRLGAADYVPKAGNYLETLADVLRDVVEERRWIQRRGLSAALSPRRVLYVEHQPMDIELTLRQFADAAPHVALDVVQSCAEALARLGQPHAYDLVLIDLWMPDMSAMDFVHEARHRHLALPPFVVVSGRGDDAAAIALLKLGSADYIAKGEGYLDQLTHIIDRVIAHEQLNRLNEQLQIELAERARVEDELREKESRLAESQRIARVGSWALDVPSHEVTWSDEAYRIYGVSPESFVPSAESLIGLLHPDDRAAMQEWIRACLADERPGPLEFRSIHPDGSTRTLNGLGELTFDAAGSPVRMIGTVQDVTERKQAEVQLRESEARFRATFEQAAVGIAHVRPDGRWLRVNQRLCDIVGYTREEMLARTFQDITHPDDVERDLNGARQLLAGEIPIYSVEKRYLCKNGQTVWVNVTVSLVRRASGEPDYQIVVAEDISDRKRAEEAQREGVLRLRMAVQGGDIGLWDWDLHTNKVHFSLEWKRQIGYEEDEISDDFDEWKSRVHPDDLGPALDAVRAYLGGAAPTCDVEFRFRHKDGSYRHILARASTVLGEDGTPTRLIGSHTDITDHTELQTQLLQAQRYGRRGSARRRHRP